jgi:transposase
MRERRGDPADTRAPTNLLKDGLKAEPTSTTKRDVRDPVEFEKRRRRAARLLRSGLSQAEIARRVGVTRQSVHDWAKALALNGLEALRRVPHRGRRPRLDAAQQRTIVAELRKGPLWTVARVKQLIEDRCGVTYRRTPLLAVMLAQAGFERCGRGGWKRAAR